MDNKEQLTERCGSYDSDSGCCPFNGECDE